MLNAADSLTGLVHAVLILMCVGTHFTITRAVDKRSWCFCGGSTESARAATGHRHSTLPFRTPTYQSNLSTVGSQCPGTRRSFSPTFGAAVSLLYCNLPCSSEALV